MRPARNVLLAGLTSLLTDVSSEMVYAVLPLYLTAVLGASPAVLGLIEGLAESVSSLLRAFSGRWSDMVGRRKPLALGGYGLSAAARIVLCVAAVWPLVMLARVLDRVGKGIRTAPRDALIAESVPRAELGRAFGLHRALDTLGAVLGVAAAYLIVTARGTDGMRLVLTVALAPGLLGLVPLALARETGRGPRMASGSTPRPPILPRGVSLPRSLKWFLFVSAVFSLGNFSNAFLILRARGPTESGDAHAILLYLLMNIVYCTAAYPAGRIADRIGRRTVLLAGFVLYAMLYATLAAARSPAVSWAVFAGMGLYMALTDGVGRAVVADLAPTEHRAGVLGLHSMITSAALLPASIIAGLLWDRVGHAAPFAFGAFLALIAAAAMLKVGSRQSA